MKISGFKKRSISTIDSQTKLAYDVDLYVSNTTGEAYMGISGYTGSVDNAANSKKLQFTFKSGRIFDPEGRCSSSYKENQIVNPFNAAKETTDGCTSISAVKVPSPLFFINL